MTDLNKDNSSQELSNFAFNVGREIEAKIKERVGEIEQENKVLQANMLQFKAGFDELISKYVHTENRQYKVLDTMQLDNGLKHIWMNRIHPFKLKDIIKCNGRYARIVSFGDCCLMTIEPSVIQGINRAANLKIDFEKGDILQTT